MEIPSARAFFEEVARRGFERRLRNVSGAWQFDIEGEGTWQIAVDAGQIKVSEGNPAATPTTTVRAAPAEFVRMVRGEDNENLITAFMRAAIEVEGDLAFGQRLQALIPLPEAPQAANLSTEVPRQS